ncbi:type IV toxin-antitoxin system AbiEi family antitoxin domain-containing protein [Quadrisphaera setariae]|uniref:DUF559 domain-containing protein n=1 Tax=Quadrisphaera setariae TaxID=2593304 RepID=A0A5C8ZEV6_9ACTN|nr:type IV toxin-antitoxin system AbiEi family antitoxin domain-containing protein [Quadrisphaera setariae]TXR55819.1 hypothetical protein FMM08_13485 [Quadrisphaera setariae]
MDVDEVCRELWRRGGVALRAEVGCDWRALERALASGRVVRLARGTYGLSSGKAPLAAAAAASGVASHASAAQLWLMDLVTAPPLPHVTVPRNRKATGGQLVRHWADLPPDDVDGWVTTPLRTVVDCARTMPFPEALAVGDSALRRGLVSRADLLDRAQATHGAGRAAVRRVAEHASERPANPFESALRGIALDAGLTGLLPQVWLDGESGSIRPDLIDPALRLVVEADSFEWHGRRSALAADCHRYDELVADGWTVLRYAWEQVMFDQAWVSSTLQRTARRCAVTADVQKSLSTAA